MAALIAANARPAIAAVIKTAPSTARIVWAPVHASWLSSGSGPSSQASSGDNAMSRPTMPPPPPTQRQTAPRANATARCSRKAQRRRSARHKGSQRLHHGAVLRFQADGDAESVPKAVVGEAAHEQPLGGEEGFRLRRRPAGRVREAGEDEVAL